MDSSAHKIYHNHCFSSREYLECYFSEKAADVFWEDTMKFPVEKIYNFIITSGAIKGDTLIDICLAPLVHHLYSVCGLFKDIILLRFNERCIMELTRWLDARTGAFDWSHTSSIVKNPERHSDEWEKKELRLKSAITQIVKCDFTKENFTDPVVLPQADCVITMWILDATCTNEEEYITTLRKILALLKPGGYLLLVGILNATFYKVGNDIMHIFRHDEDFVTNALTSEGFTVTHSEVFQRTAKSDLTDYKAMSFVAARKNN